MIAVVDEAGRPVPLEGGRLALEEARRYRIHGATDVRWDGRPLPAVTGGAFLLEVGHRVGRIRLDWNVGESPGGATAEVQPRAEKLGPELWLRLVEDLEAWLPSVTVGLDGARHGGVGSAGVSGGASAGWIAEALLPLVPMLVRAVEDLLATLRVRANTRLEDLPLRMARQVRRETLTWVGRHPDAAQWLQPWKEADLAGKPPAVPLRRTFDTLDHPANRYVHWLVRRVVARLVEVGDRLASIGGEEPLKAWCRARAELLFAASERLQTLLKRSSLRTVPPAGPTEAALGVVLDDPRYARVHALARRFVSPRFSMAESDTPASVRPSFGIYEIWCFFAAYRALSTVDGFAWTPLGMRKLLDPQGSGGGARVVGRSPEGTLTLWCNPTFASYGFRAGRARWSLSKERRPDLAVTWKPQGSVGAPAWLVLDAKYRVGSNLVDAFTSVHLYRDALRWEGYGGGARAGVLLGPSRTADTADYFTESFRETHGMGAFEARPGMALAPLATWILATLGAR